MGYVADPEGNLLEIGSRRGVVIRSDAAQKKHFFMTHRRYVVRPGFPQIRFAFLRFFIVNYLIEILMAYHYADFYTHHLCRTTRTVRGNMKFG
jgi:hypothetical protein